MSIQLTKPLVVPEYTNALVKSYIPDLVTGAIVRPPYTINVQTLLSSLIAGKTARPNACALNGNDLFIAHSSASSQCIFKLPNYLSDPEQAIARGFVFSLDGNDYVGMAFSAAGELYAAEGSFANNRIFRYTGTAKPYPGPALAALSNYASRTDMGNAGMQSYFANLAFDATGNLWVSDYLNHRVVVFDKANLGGTNTFHVLTSLTGSIPVANTDAALNANTSHLFAEPEGLDFDAGGNLWVANNNDGGGAGGVQTTKTSLVKLTPGIQQGVLATAAGGSLTPTVAQSNTDFFIYQVPNLANNGAVRPQFGGLQIDRVAARLFVNEQKAGKGRGYDIATIAAMGTSTAANDLNIVSTNPGNGGIALVNAAAPIAFIRDNNADTGSEPNATTTVAWQSVDIWVRQFNDGVTVGEPILGGSQSFVSVRIQNKGLSPTDASQIVRLYWAKASTGLSYPAPWNGAVAKDGGTVAAPQSIGVIQPGQNAVIVFAWAATPNPVDYIDGHFCLLAHVTNPGAPEFDGFQGTNLNQNVLALNEAGWRNIHITPAVKMQLGHMVVANYTAKEMHAHIAFEILDASARPINPSGATLLITPKGAALDKLREQQVDRPYLEAMGHGTFRVLDIDTGIPHLRLKPGEILPFGLEYVPDHEAKGYVVRATQFSLEGAVRETIGGQTFVAGEVAGYTTPPRYELRRKRPVWPWVTASLTLVILMALLRKKD